MELVLTIMVGTNEILIMQFGWQTSCQQEFEIETCHVTSWVSIFGNVCPSFSKSNFSSFLLLSETDEAERWHITTTHITTSLGWAKC